MFLRVILAAIAGAAAVVVGFLHASDARAAGPTAGVRPLGPGLDLNVRPEDRCPVCGMRPGNYPKFSCAIQLVDGQTFYFCSAGCMLRTWIHPEIFLSVPGDRLKLVVTREYFSGLAVDAKAAVWVAGSGVVGPMGPAFVPLVGDRHLAAFLRRHGGKHVFRLIELTDAVWQTITGQQAAPRQ